jgi:hypothetical protein
VPQLQAKAPAVSSSQDRCRRIARTPLLALEVEHLSKHATTPPRELGRDMLLQIGMHGPTFASF